MQSPHGDRTPAGDGGPPAAGKAAPTAVGLSEREAAVRLERYGPNAPPVRRRVRLTGRVLNQLGDPLIIVLLAAAVLTIATRDFPNAVVILLVIAANTTVGVTQEVRANRAIEQLAALSAPAARVIREGVEREIPASEVVPGDLVVLTEGEIVPADAELVESVALATDESMLTGEAVPVDKSAAASEHAGDQVAAGTVVVRGRGKAVVTATGAQSAMGRIAGLLTTELVQTPLQRRLSGLARVLAISAGVLCLVVFVLGVAGGQPWQLMVLTAISLMVAAVPESLPAVITLSLALGARRMAGRRAIVRNLPAVETLGSVTLIATDKTGTLTEGTMVVQRLWTPGTEATVTGEGYEPHGDVLCAGRKVSPHDVAEVGHLLRAGVLCTDAAIGSPTERSGGRWTAIGDPTEAAILVAGAKIGLTRTDLEAELPRIDEVPFDNARKRMTTLHRAADGSALVICKGAPEVLLQPPFLADEPDLVMRARQRTEELARDGFRVLAVAARQHDPQRGELPSREPAQLERGLRLLGLIAIADPPRASAKHTIDACRAAGITPVLVTGDHRATARSIARQVGIGGDDPRVVDGADLASGGVPDVRTTQVFARTSPEQKLDIIRGYQRESHVVAMTGDGVNDAPALRRADIGVAMGLRGTEVAREAADLVLADDELATLVGAVEEGRRIYANVRRFLLFGLSGGAAEILVMLAGPFLGFALPLLPAQILWINLLTHGPVGVALGAEPAAGDLMRVPPRSPAERILGAGLWQRIVRIAVAITAVTLGAAVWAANAGRPWQTVTFLALATTQLGVAVGSRARPGTLANPFLLLGVVGALGLLIAAVYVSALQQVLGTVALSPAELAVCGGCAVVGYLAVRLDRLVHPVKRPRR
ncbi:MAG TPA: cation-transporting P-type ATPase [Actinopolymorphaceae bacterium]